MFAKSKFFRLTSLLLHYEKRIWYRTDWSFSKWDIFLEPATAKFDGKIMKTSTCNKSQFPKSTNFENDYLENHSMKIWGFVERFHVKSVQLWNSLKKQSFCFSWEVLRFEKNRSSLFELNIWWYLSAYHYCQLPLGRKRLSQKMPLRPLLLSIHVFRNTSSRSSRFHLAIVVQFFNNLGQLLQILVTTRWCWINPKGETSESLFDEFDIMEMASQQE